MASKQKESIVDSINSIDDNDIDMEIQPNPSMVWFWASLPTILFAIFSFIGLVTYDWNDVAALNSNGNSQVQNLMGVAGANYTYLSYLFWGIAAWVLPVWLLICAVAFFRRERLGWRFLWMLMITISLAALFQIFFKSNLTYVLSDEKLNIAPNGGGIVGYLLTDLFVYKWLGLCGSLCIFIPMLIAGIILLIGFSRIGCYILALRSRISSASEVDRQELANLRQKQREQKEEIRQERLRLEAEAKQKKREEKLAEARERQQKREEAAARRQEEKEAKKHRSSISIAEEVDDSSDNGSYDDYGALDPDQEEPGEFSNNSNSGENDNVIRVDIDSEEDSIFLKPTEPQKATRKSRKPTRVEPSIEHHEVETVAKDSRGVITGTNDKKKDFSLPSTSMLTPAVKQSDFSGTADEIKVKSKLIEDTLAEFRIKVNVFNVVSGPVITCYELKPEVGVRVENISRYANNLQMTLEAKSMRILSPIPGKNAIGIEVPNQYRAMVTMKEIITKMPNKKHKLYVPVGKDITGTPLSFPICDMPHCLISGATNSGKSVCANTIILSLLMNYKPSEVRLIMVDPKRVEMLFYKDIPHLLCPIITESEKARVALDKLCVEMNKRFTEFSKVGVKNIASYNEHMVSQGKYKMPFILLVVDEFAELMLCKNHNAVEERIQKLAQLGRAAGIHLILSTQRPDVNVIPGTIKTNLPCRMTFRLSSLADSRTVIDVSGAEKLLNNGDMLLLTPDFTGLRRVQGVYVSDKEIADVVEYCKKQAKTQYDPNFLDLRTEEEKMEDEKLKYVLNGNNNNESSTRDEMYEEVKTLVIRDGKASASYLQRKFPIGYAKASRYIDMLEEDGIIGPENGSKPREVLVNNEEHFNEQSEED